MTGQIYKVHSNLYFVSTNEGKTIKCSARGLFKLKGQELVVGDVVEVEKNTIVKVFNRKNLFIRPSVANVDLLIIVISSVPEPDLLLVDKLLINAEYTEVEKLILINKSELDKNLYKKIKNEYKNAGVEIMEVSAKEGVGKEKLKEKLNGKLCVFAGQSAVGKTSLVNSLFNMQLKTGEVSEKIGRGKHTTTYSQIYEQNGVKIIDSPGFAILDAFVELDSLKDCYSEFLSYQKECRFRGCSHVNEPDCAVKNAVDKGEISIERYNRYLIIYNELKEKGKLYGKY